MKRLFFCITMIVLCCFVTSAHAKLTDNLIAKDHFDQNERLLEKAMRTCSNVEHKTFADNYKDCWKDAYRYGRLTAGECRLWAILDAKEEYDRCMFSHWEYKIK